jgi:hypothetical protein
LTPTIPHFSDHCIVYYYKLLTLPARICRKFNELKIEAGKLQGCRREFRPRLCTNPWIF